VLGIPAGQSRLCRDIAILADDRHIYTFILATLTPDQRLKHMPVLRELVRTAHGAGRFGRAT